MEPYKSIIAIVCLILYSGIYFLGLRYKNRPLKNKAFYNHEEWQIEYKQREIEGEGFDIGFKFGFFQALVLAIVTYFAYN